MSLNLDARQRAMLSAMGITHWWPEAPAEAADGVAVAPAPAEAAPTGTPTTQPPSAAPGAPPGVATMAPRSAAPVAERPLAQGVAVPPASGAAANLDWPGLQAAVAACTGCGLCQTRRNTVFGVGQTPQAPQQAPRVDWLIVGEAPGENEDLQGEPFVGQAGKLLDAMLRAVGRSRHDGGVYIANVLKCRPPGNRNPAPEEVARCAPYLQRQIELLRPRLILAMGRFAIDTLLAETVPDVANQPVGRLRGRVHHHRGIPVVVTYHPAYLLRNLPDKAKAWADLCLALALTPEAADAAEGAT